MDALIEFSKGIIHAYGYLGIFFLTTIEHFIFPIPADVFIAIGTGNGLLVWKVLIIVLVAALVGSTIGYYLGKYLGHPAFVWLFGKTRLDKGEAFIKKWGIWAVIGAGLTPFPFKLMTWIAGIFEMPYKKFVVGVIIGRMPRYVLTAYAGKLIVESDFLKDGNMAALVLGAVQGITEFLPVSSSGHLAVLEYFTELPFPTSQFEVFNLILHGGSLLAILIYFWKDWKIVFRELWQSIRTFKIEKDSTLFKLTVATLPLIVASLAFGAYFTQKFNSLTSIAIIFILTGLLYFFATWKGRHVHFESVGLKKAVFMGVAQITSIFPGTSSIGMMMATGVAQKIKPEVAAKFSFMLGAVTIFLGSLYQFLILSTGDIDPPSISLILTGTITSFICGLTAIYLLMSFFKKYSLRSFGVYLIIAGGFILGFLQK